MPGYRSVGNGVCTGASGGASTVFGTSTTLTEVVGVLWRGEFLEMVSQGHSSEKAKRLYCDKHGSLESSGEEKLTRPSKVC